MAAACISYGYALFTGTYNGDYIGKTINLAQGQLLLNLLYTLLPFIILFGLYACFREKKCNRTVSIPTRFLAGFLLISLIFQLILVVIYDAGALGIANSSAALPPVLLYPFRVIYRFSPLIGILLYYLTPDRNRKMLLLLCSLLFILYILRGSLMIFVYFGLFLLMEYHIVLLNYIKKHWLLVIAIVLLAPLIVSALYDLRENIRNTPVEEDDVPIELSSAGMITGKLVGRLSSFTNSAVIMEREDTLSQLARNHFSVFQYPKEALGQVYGSVLPANSYAYTNILLRCEGKNTPISYMLGTQGALLLSTYHSATAFWLALFTMIATIILSFGLCRFIPGQTLNKWIFMLFCIPVMSGVASEYMKILSSLLLYILLFFLWNTLSKKRI